MKHEAPLMSQYTLLVRITIISDVQLFGTYLAQSAGCFWGELAECAELRRLRTTACDPTSFSQLVSQLVLSLRQPSN